MIIVDDDVSHLGILFRLLQRQGMII